MNFFSLHFILFLSVVVIVYYLKASQLYRQWVLSLANILFLLTFLTTTQSAVALASFLLISYAILAMIRLGITRYIAWAGIVLAVSGLVVVKHYGFVQFLLPESLLRTPLEFIGFSYMTFKWIHLAVDLQQGQLNRITFFSYLNYQIGFFSLAAGPIQLYNGFQRFWESGKETPQDGREELLALNRVLNGLFKIGCLGALSILLYREAVHQLHSANSPWQVAKCLLIIFYGYPIYLYFNFSGYCDAVIGAARLLGMTHQENFDKPWLARDMIDFWNRWHISLSQWIREYVFMTSYKSLVTRRPAWGQIGGYFLLFLALFLAGVWHGPTKNFVIFGFIQGAGVAISRIYADILKRKLGREGMNRYLSNPRIRIGAIAVTLNYICFSFLFFEPGALDRLSAMYQAVRRVF